jgi:hypothetical protein
MAARFLFLIRPADLYLKPETLIAKYQTPKQPAAISRIKINE